MGRTFDGGYAQYTLVPASNVVLVETELDWGRLGALPEVLQTAYGSLTTGIDAQPARRLQTSTVVGTYTITNPPGIGRWQAQISEVGTTNQVGKMAGGFDANPLDTTQGVYKGEWKICN